MPFSREINRVFVGALVAFAAVGLAAAYWAITGADTILLREDNPRNVLAEASILRGAIVDRDDEILARTVGGDDGGLKRDYPEPASHGAVGYYSLRYGAGGAEAAFDSALRGDDVPVSLSDALVDGLLHRAPAGSDVRLSLDLDVQRVLAGQMAGQRGAAVVMHTPTGQILGMVSRPTYDPNTLDAEWDSLLQAPGNPFFNRVIQGAYQPGAMLQTPLMAAALISNRSINVPINGATQSVDVDGVRLSCAVRLPDRPLSLREAYAFACPSPFAALASTLGLRTVAAALDTFGLNSRPTLAGFEPALPAQAAPRPTAVPAEIPDEVDLAAVALGQEALTVSPLGMAMMVAGIVNDGNAPQPSILLHTRPPGADTWSPDTTIRPTIPIATAFTARQLQDLLRQAAAQGAALNAARPGLDIGGHAAVAYSGEGPLAWFIGFATLAGRQGVTVAVVLENSDDPGLAADIGGQALAAAAQALIEESAAQTGE